MCEKQDISPEQFFLSIHPACVDFKKWKGFSYVQLPLPLQVYQCLPQGLQLLSDSKNEIKATVAVLL